MARKRSEHEDDEVVVEQQQEEAQEGEQAQQQAAQEGGEPQAADEQQAQAEEEGKQAVREFRQEGAAAAETDHGRKHRYYVKVSRNASEWSEVAHTSLGTAPDGRDRYQVPCWYTKAEAEKIAEQWVAGGFEVLVVDRDTGEPVERKE